MEIYKGLINPNKYKQLFIKELISVFSPLENGYEKWLETQKPNIYIVKAEDIANVLKITFTEYALIEKISCMLYKGGGLRDVIIMLNSFSNGPKRLRSNPYGEREHDGYYDWTSKNGNEKFSHKGNVPNAHFRWNHGKRYTLTELDLKIIKGFIHPFFQLLNN